MPLCGGRVWRAVPAFGGRVGPVVAPPCRPRSAPFCSCPAAAAGTSSASPLLPRLACLCPLVVAVYGAPLPLFSGRVLRAVAALWWACVALRSRCWRPCVARRSPSPAAAPGVSSPLPGGRVWPSFVFALRPWRARRRPSSAAAVGASLPALGGRGWRISAPTWRPRLEHQCPAPAASAVFSLPGGRGRRVIGTPLAAAVGATLPPSLGGRVWRVVAPYLRPQVARLCHPLAAAAGASLPVPGSRGGRVVVPAQRPVLERLCQCWARVWA